MFMPLNNYTRFKTFMDSKNDTGSKIVHKCFITLLQFDFKQIKFVTVYHEYLY